MPRKRPSTGNSSKPSIVQEFRFISAIPDSDNAKRRLRTIVRSNATKWQWTQSRSGGSAEIVGSGAANGDSTHLPGPSSDDVVDLISQFDSDTCHGPGQASAAPSPLSEEYPNLAMPRFCASGDDSWVRYPSNGDFGLEYHLHSVQREYPSLPSQVADHSAQPPQCYFQDEIDQALRNFTNEAFQEDIPSDLPKRRDHGPESQTLAANFTPSYGLTLPSIQTSTGSFASQLPEIYCDKMFNGGLLCTILLAPLTDADTYHKI